MKSVDLHAQRWSAVTWESVAHGDFEDEYAKHQGICPEVKAMIADEKTAKRGFGTVGCYLSHLTALINASKQLQSHEFVLMMEDDVIIPQDWKNKLQSLLDEAPKDWGSLKLTGFAGGVRRLADLETSSNIHSAQQDGTPSLPSVVSNFGHTLKNVLKAALPVSATDYFMKLTTDATSPFTYWKMHLPFKETPINNWGTFGWGQPNIFYGNTGAYVVRGSYIQELIDRLRSKPIDDVDKMMLTDGTTNSYDTYPHIFELDENAQTTGLHSLTSFDEVDAANQRRVGDRGTKHIFMGTTAAWEFLDELPHQGTWSLTRAVSYIGGLIAMTLLIVCSIQLWIRKERGN
jgi:GR25 family glycosyltransferase involved in LPS biosynthesis